MEPKNITKPILKWVGGKTQILTDVLNNGDPQGTILFITFSTEGHSHQSFPSRF